MDSGKIQSFAAVSNVKGEAVKPDSISPGIDEWQAIIDQVLQQINAVVEAMLRPWWLLQIFVIVICYAAAHFAAEALTPPLENRLRRIEAQPQLLRIFVVPLRRLKWIVLALALWLSTILINQFTWTSRSYYVGVAATLVAAWVIISVISRFIRNRSLAHLFAVSAWSIVALGVVGLVDDAFAILDNLALPIGNFRLSLLIVLKGVLLLVALIWLATVASDFIERRLRKNEDLAPALQVLIGKAAKFLLLTIAILATLSAMGVDFTALTVFSGALGLGIGLGLQKVASNLISGIIILMDRSIKPGDVISLGETFGWINSLQSRYVSVLTRDGVEYLIPNEIFVAEQVVNWSHTNRTVRLEIKFGVSYDADPHEVRKLAVEAISSLERILSTPAPVCHLAGFGDSSIDFVLRFWIRDPVRGLTNIKGAAFLAIWDAFKTHDIDIPFPQRELLLQQPIRIESVEKIPRRRSSADTAVQARQKPQEDEQVAVDTTRKTTKA